jgi:hypothetical protein
MLLNRFAQEGFLTNIYLKDRRFHLVPDVTVSAPPATEKMISTKYNKYIKILSFD